MARICAVIDGYCRSQRSEFLPLLCTRFNFKSRHPRPNKPSPDPPAWDEGSGTGWASSQLATGSASKIATPDGGWADEGQAR